MELTHIHKKAIEVLHLNIKAKTSKGWIIGASCPFCGSSEKFGIKLNVPNGRYDNHISYNCFRGSCQEKGGEFLLFTQLGIADFLRQRGPSNVEAKVKTTLEQDVDADSEIDCVAPTVSAPIGFKRVFSHEYLEGRGFEPWQFETYVIGVNQFLSKFKDYIIFLVLEDGLNKGYVARSLKSKEWIESYNERIKQENKDKPKSERKSIYLRYSNEGGVDFGKLLFGIDQVTKFTRIVILVEGITDKANIDRWLMKNDLDQEIVCLCTFGKKVSDAQRIKLLSKIPNLEIVYVMYDPDAVNQSKQYSISLEEYVPQVMVCFLDEKDPGDLSFDEIDLVIKNSESASSFALNKVQKRDLR